MWRAFGVIVEQSGLEHTDKNKKMPIELLRCKIYYVLYIYVYISRSKRKKKQSKLLEFSVAPVQFVEYLFCGAILLHFKIDYKLWQQDAFDLIRGRCVFSFLSIRIVTFLFSVFCSADWVDRVTGIFLFAFVHTLLTPDHTWIDPTAFRVMSIVLHFIFRWFRYDWKYPTRENIACWRGVRTFKATAEYIYFFFGRPSRCHRKVCERCVWIGASIDQSRADFL